MKSDLERLLRSLQRSMTITTCDERNFDVRVTTDGCVTTLTGLKSWSEAYSRGMELACASPR